MSMNSALNAAVALIEGRTDIAKEIIRAPGSDVLNVPAIMSRLERAVNKAAAKAISNVLIRSLAIQPTSDILTNKNLSEAFYVGVTSVEKIFEQAIAELGGDNGL